MQISLIRIIKKTYVYTHLTVDGGGRRKTSGDGGPPVVSDWLSVATPTAKSLYKNDSSSG